MANIITDTTEIPCILFTPGFPQKLEKYTQDNVQMGEWARHYLPVILKAIEHIFQTWYQEIKACVEEDNTRLACKVSPIIINESGAKLLCNEFGAIFGLAWVRDDHRQERGRNYTHSLNKDLFTTKNSGEGPEVLICVTTFLWKPASIQFGNGEIPMCRSVLSADNNSRRHYEYALAERGDVTLISEEGESFSFHHSFLIGRGNEAAPDFFERGFGNGMSESASKEMQLHECPSSVLRAFRDFIYLNEISKTEQKNLETLLGLLTFSDMIGIHALTEYIKDLILNVLRETPTMNQEMILTLIRMAFDRKIPDFFVPCLTLAENLEGGVDWTLLANSGCYAFFVSYASRSYKWRKVEIQLRKVIGALPVPPRAEEVAEPAAEPEAIGVDS